MEFVALRKDEKEWQGQYMRDGEHIGRLWEVDRGDLWHVFRHRDGILVCWECIPLGKMKEPMRIVTNTNRVDELHKYLPKL